MCLEIGSKPEEAIPYCQKAISVCKSRVQRLSDEAKSLPAEASATTETGPTVLDKKSEIETLIGLCGELEKKVRRQGRPHMKSFFDIVLTVIYLVAA